jgi:hypothetical protein
MGDTYSQPPFHGRADEALFQGRLGPDAMRHYRWAMRLIGIALIVGILSLGVSVTLTATAHATNVISVIVTAVLFLAISIAGMIEYGRVKYLAGAYYGLSRRESRHLDVWTPERFDETLSAIDPQR